MARRATVIVSMVQCERDADGNATGRTLLALDCCYIREAEGGNGTTAIPFETEIMLAPTDFLQLDQLIRDQVNSVLGSMGAGNEGVSLAEVVRL